MAHLSADHTSDIRSYGPCSTARPCETVLLIEFTRREVPTKDRHLSSGQVVDRLRTRLSFQISVDVGTLDLGLTVASAAVAGGVDIIEMGTPLLKTRGVSNVVPVFGSVFQWHCC